ncbi:hypothetical protein HYH03_015241 [Edaphochlamys debaryana]|uniref:Uncharacterized protein n=1 Tax=Edaphochlamys debaryana TaxID=47281 RepID=A0A835XL11_9CHLO|nr:hypothetical protein HYH03_015241 [Edaphochlamys debaryana]|eukprot:KAG2486033.1 hypothetical protein HYH03_015241 [Edaphochlamys debaryana]
MEASKLGSEIVREEDDEAQTPSRDAARLPGGMAGESGYGPSGAALAGLPPYKYSIHERGYEGQPEPRGYDSEHDAKDKKGKWDKTWESPLFQRKKGMDAPEKGWSNKSRAKELLKKLDVHEGDVVKYDKMVSIVEHVAAHAGDAGPVHYGGGGGGGGVRFRWYLVALAVAVAIIIGAMTGIMWAVVDAQKDTQVASGGVLQAKSSGETIRTESMDLQVVDGVLVSRSAYRQALDYANVAAQGASGQTVSSDTTVTWQRGGAVDPASAGVLRTATFKGNRQRFSSRVDIESLMELNFIYITSATGAEVAVAVHGVARVPKDSSVWGNVVRIITSVGTLTLDDTVVHFAADIAPIFQEAGFQVTNGGFGRRLQASSQYTLYGYFNSIQNISTFDPVDVSKPKLPIANYTLELTVYESCTLPSEPTVNRCLYDPSGLPTAKVTTNRRRRNLHDATTAADAQPMPGVTKLNGQPFMTHTRRVSYSGHMVRVVSVFPARPGLQRVQLVDTSSGQVNEWQEEVHPDAEPLDPGAERGACSSHTLGAEALAALTALRDLGSVKFEYMGDEQKLNRPCRHFVYEVKQPPLGGVSLPDTIKVDYWDTLDTFSPMAFEINNHPVLGSVRYYVNALTFLANETLPEAAWAAPAAEACNVGCMPRLGSAFSVPVPSQRWHPMAGGSSRRMALAGASHAQHAAAARASHAQHALATGFTQTMEVARRALLADANPLCTGDPVRYADVPLSPGGACSVTWGVRGSKFVTVKAACDQDGGVLAAAPALRLGGAATVDTCLGVTQGCLLASLTPPAACCTSRYGVALSVFNALGGGSSNFQMCGSYDWGDRLGCMGGSAANPLPSWGGRVEAYAQLRFAAGQNAWVSEVGFESYVGVNLGLFQIYQTVGAVDFARDAYLAGSGEDTNSVLQRSVNNEDVSYITLSPGVKYPIEYYVFVGYWGDWTPWSYCYEVDEQGELVGIPMRGLRLKVDDDPFAEDKTGLDAVEMTCRDGSTLRPSSGLFGAWTDYKECPNSGIIVGAQMRVADPAPDGGDNTAVNSLSVKCNDGTVLTPDQGYTGGWRDWVECEPDAFVCGIRLRLQADQGPEGDDSALNGMQMQCCRPGA